MPPPQEIFIKKRVIKRLPVTFLVAKVVALYWLLAPTSDHEWFTHFSASQCQRVQVLLLSQWRNDRQSCQNTRRLDWFMFSGRWLTTGDRRQTTVLERAESARQSSVYPHRQIARQHGKVLHRISGGNVGIVVAMRVSTFYPLALDFWPKRNFPSPLRTPGRTTTSGSSLPCKIRGVARFQTDVNGATGLRDSFLALTERSLAPTYFSPTRGISRPESQRPESLDFPV
jgi:hypothetical protein